MCGNCLPYRDGHPVAEHVPEPVEERTEDPIATLQSGLGARFNRRQLLRGMGGLVATLAAGSVGWEAGLAASRLTAKDSLPYLVLIVLDGARREYFDVPNIPHVRGLINSGTRYTSAFAGILEAETPAAHAAIGTGSAPNRDGILSFAWGNDNDVRVNLFDPTIVRDGAMERIVSAAHVPTLAGLVHKSHPGARVVALSGSKYYAADAIGGPNADVIMYFATTKSGKFAPTNIPKHGPPSGILGNPALAYKNTHLPPGMENHLAMQLAVDTFNRMKQRVTLINLPESDWPLGHVKGSVIDMPGVRTRMYGFDQDLAMLQHAYRKAGVLDRTIFVIMGDHGMMPLTGKVNASDIEDAVSRAGTDFVSKSFSSAAYLWVKDENLATQAGINILALGNPHIQSVYVQTHSNSGYAYKRLNGGIAPSRAALAANQYLMGTFAGPNGPDIVVVFKEGVGSEPNGQSGWKADHGGPSWESQHLPLIISGPGVRKGHVSSSPARLIDIAPTVLQLMGVSHKGMQGIPLADAMVKPPSWTVNWQRKVNAKLSPVIQGLQAQSRIDRGADA